MFAINSATLNRIIWVVSSKEEMSRLLADGVLRSNIYTAAEITTLKGITPEGLVAVQKVKDAIPGSYVELFEADYQDPEAPQEPAPAAVQLDLLSLQGDH